MIGECREAFEKWALETGGFILKQLVIGPDGEYVSSHAEAAWDGWRAQQNRIDYLEEEIMYMHQDAAVGDVRILAGHERIVVQAQPASTIEIEVQP